MTSHFKNLIKPEKSCAQEDALLSPD